MNLYLNKDAIVINNKFENQIFIYNRKMHQKSIINEDMFEILEYIYNNEGITLKELNEVYDDLTEIINSLISLDILTKRKQKRCNNIKKLKDKNNARLFV